MSTRAPKGRVLEAVQYQLEHGLSNEETAQLFNVKIGSLNCARYHHNIPHPNPKRMGVGIHAAKIAAYTDATIEEAMKIADVSRGTLISSARRLGIKLRKLNLNRNLMNNRGTYYFRVRTKSFNAFWFLGKDVEAARIMRDQLEIFFKTLK